MIIQFFLYLTIALLLGCLFFGALLALAACMRSSEISREEEQAGAAEGAWPKRIE